MSCGSNETGFLAVIFCFECGEREREKREGKEREKKARFQMMAWTFYDVDKAIYIFKSI